MSGKKPTLKDVLASYPACPVCGHRDRSACNPPRLQTSPYTGAIAKVLGMEPDALLAASAMWTCRRCDSRWRDPWLTRAAAEWLYHTAYPSHRYGWISAQHWSDGGDGFFLATRASVWTYLRDRLKEPIRYAELNCPLTGLAFAEAEARSGARAREHLSMRDQAISRDQDLPDLPDISATGIFSSRTLLLSASPLCWGEKCRSPAGSKCREVADKFLFDRIATLEEARKRSERFDVIGSFLTIDHTPSFSQTVSHLLELAEAVILEIHAPEWFDLQHLYQISPKCFDLLKGSGIRVREITETAYAFRRDEPRRDTLIFVLSRHEGSIWMT